MMLLTCPVCGPRNVSEFRSLGEVVVRPDPAVCSRAEWRRYLYLRRNVAGSVRERWMHRAGCGEFFDAERDTTNNAVARTWSLVSPARSDDS